MVNTALVFVGNSINDKNYSVSAQVVY